MPATLSHFNQNRMASTKLLLTGRNSIFYITKLALKLCGSPLCYYRVLKLFTNKGTCFSISWTLNQAFRWKYARQLSRLKDFCL